MSLWMPKRDRAGRWKLYSIGVPTGLVVIAALLLAMLIMGFIAAFT